MNDELTKTNIYHILLMVSFTVSMVSSCGGGSTNTADNKATSTQAVVTAVETDTTSEEVADFTPAVEKLSLDATSSVELYVEPTFNFDSFKTLTIDISASNSTNNPLDQAMVSISAIADSITAFDDPLLADKSLLTKMLTDTNGQVLLRLEVPDSINTLLLEINAVGIENEIIFIVDESNSVVHHFY